MNKLTLGLGLAAGATLLLVISSGAKSSEAKGVTALPLVVNVDAYYAQGYAQVPADKTTLTPPAGLVNTWKLIAKAYSDRRLTLPKDAGGKPDKYSKTSVLVFRLPNVPGAYAPERLGPNETSLQPQLDNAWGWYWTDEYGRPYEGWGVSVSSLGIALKIAQTVLPLIPGVGTAASASIAACIALSQGKSIKDSAVAAARASLPAGAQIAFDVGLGIANGQSLDESTKNALINQVPGGHEAYNKGIAIVKKAGLK